MLLNIETFQNVYTTYVATNRRLQEVFGHSATLIQTDFSKGANTIPYPEWINTFETNLAEMAKHTDPLLNPPTRKWVGGTADTPRFSSKDIARWLHWANLIKENADARYQNKLFLGTFWLSSNRTLQKFGRERI